MKAESLRWVWREGRCWEGGWPSLRLPQRLPFARCAAHNSTLKLDSCRVEQGMQVHEPLGQDWQVPPPRLNEPGTHSSQLLPARTKKHQLQLGCQQTCTAACKLVRCGGPTSPAITANGKASPSQLHTLHPTPPLTRLVGLGAGGTGCDGHRQQQRIQGVAGQVGVGGFGAQAGEVDLQNERRAWRQRWRVERMKPVQVCSCDVCARRHQQAPMLVPICAGAVGGSQENATRSSSTHLAVRLQLEGTRRRLPPQPRTTTATKQAGTSQQLLWQHSSSSSTRTP